MTAVQASILQILICVVALLHPAVHCGMSYKGFLANVAAMTVVIGGAAVALKLIHYGISFPKKLFRRLQQDTEAEEAEHEADQDRQNFDSACKIAALEQQMAAVLAANPAWRVENIVQPPTPDSLKVAQESAGSDD